MREITWRTWVLIGVILAVDGVGGWWLAMDGNAEASIYKYGLLAATAMPLVFAGLYTAFGIRGAARWWTNTLGFALVAAGLTLLPITAPLAYVFWFDHGMLTQSWLAWVEVSGPVLSALVWVGLCRVWLRVYAAKDAIARAKDSSLAARNPAEKLDPDDR